MSYPLIDFHSDTFSKKLFLIKNRFVGEYLKLKFPDVENFFDVNPERTINSNLRIQTQSLYMMDSFMDKPLKYSLKILNLIHSFIEENTDYYLVKSANDIDIINKYGIIISIEGLEVIENDLDLLDLFYKLGVRIIAPNWNRLTPWFSPVTENTGALSKSSDLVKKLNKMNVLVDISHMSDSSVRDLERNYNGVMIASHSNIRALNSHKRNLSDELIEIIKERKGIIGINTSRDFLFFEAENLKKRYKNIVFSEILKYDNDYTHLDYSKNTFPVSFLWVLGILEYLDKKSALENVSIGADFDGITKYSPGLENHSGFSGLAIFLEKASIRDDVIQGLFYKNGLRVLHSLGDK